MLVIIISLVFAIAISAFALQNAGVVAIHFLWYQLELSQAVVILCSALVGVLIVIPFYLIKTVKFQFKAMEFKSEISGLKKEIEGLKSQKPQTNAVVDISAADVKVETDDRTKVN